MSPNYLQTDLPVPLSCVLMLLLSWRDIFLSSPRTWTDLTSTNRIWLLWGPVASSYSSRPSETLQLESPFHPLTASYQVKWVVILVTEIKWVWGTGRRKSIWLTAITRAQMWKLGDKESGTGILCGWALDPHHCEPIKWFKATKFWRTLLYNLIFCYVLQYRILIKNCS